MNVLKIAKHYPKFCDLLKTTTRGHSSSNLYASKYFLISTSREDMYRICADILLSHWGVSVLLSDYDTVFYFLYIFFSRLNFIGS